MTESLVAAFNQADGATLSKGNWTTGFPLSNLKTGRTTQVARSASGNRSATCFKIAKTLPDFDANEFRIVALINHNLVGVDPVIFPSESTQYRIFSIRDSAAAAAFNMRAKPDVLIASSNLTGTVAAVQDADPESPDSSTLTANVATANTDARVSFDVGGCFLQSGVGLQEVRITCRRTGGGGTHPALTADLWQSGSFVSNLVTGQVIAQASPLFDIITLTFNSTLLSGSPPAANTVQLRVRGIASATATVEFLALEFNPEPFVGTVGTVTVTDSTWTTPSLPSGFWLGRKPTRKLALAYIAPTSYRWDEIWVQAKAAVNEDPYFEAGRVVVADPIVLEWQAGELSSPDYGLRLRPIDDGERTRMGDGTLLTEGGPVWYEMDVRYSMLTTESEKELRDELSRVGSAGDMLWIPYPDDPEQPIIWGPAKPGFDFEHANVNAHNATVTIEER